MSVKITYRNSFSGEVHDTLEAAAKHSNEFHHDCIGELIDEQLALRDLGGSVIGMKLKIVDAIVDDRPALLKVLKDIPLRNCSWHVTKSDEISTIQCSRSK